MTDHNNNTFTHDEILFVSKNHAGAMHLKKIKALDSKTLIFSIYFST